MEACGSAHVWARRLQALGFEVLLPPPQYVRPCVQRNKTDRADCEAILEAALSPRIQPVAVKSEDQQAILALHRVRGQWKNTRTARIAGMRGLLREFGIVAPTGAAKFLERLPQLLEESRATLPERVRRRTLLIHGARSALTAALGRRRSGKPLTHLQQWVVEKCEGRHMSQASVALANKMARTT